MSSEELLRLGARLRADRSSLEGALWNLCRAEEVIARLHLPFFEGDAPGDAEAIRGRPQDQAQHKAPGARVGKRMSGRSSDVGICQRSKGRIPKRSEKSSGV